MFMKGQSRQQSLQMPSGHGTDYFMLLPATPDLGQISNYWRLNLKRNRKIIDFRNLQREHPGRDLWRWLALVELQVPLSHPGHCGSRYFLSTLPGANCICFFVYWPSM